QAALRVPDHGRLHPYHFFVYQHEQCQQFSQLLVTATQQAQLDDKFLAKAQKVAEHAPMIIVVASRYQAHKKVPYWEQLLTAGCAVQAMQMAAFAQGFGAKWLTGPWLETDVVRQAFNCQAEDKVVGFLLVGSVNEPYGPLKHIDSQCYTTYCR